MCIVSEYRIVMENFSTYFPAADSEEESQDIRLLLLLKLFDVLEGTHLDYRQKAKVSKAIKRKKARNTGLILRL